VKWIFASGFRDRYNPKKFGYAPLIPLADGGSATDTFKLDNSLKLR
jgi:hypothetical protein